MASKKSDKVGDWENPVRKVDPDVDVRVVAGNFVTTSKYVYMDWLAEVQGHAVLVDGFNVNGSGMVSLS